MFQCGKLRSGLCVRDIQTPTQTHTTQAILNTQGLRECSGSSLLIMPQCLCTIQTLWTVTLKNSPCQTSHDQSPSDTGGCDVQGPTISEIELEKKKEHGDREREGGRK